MNESIIAPCVCYGIIVVLMFGFGLGTQKENTPVVWVVTIIAALLWPLTLITAIGYQMAAPTDKGAK